MDPLFLVLMLGFPLLSQLVANSLRSRFVRYYSESMPMTGAEIVQRFPGRRRRYLLIFSYEQGQVVASAKKNSSRPSSTASPEVPAAIRNNLFGDEYGKLTVIAFGGYRGTAILWRCRCECGNTADYYRANLRSGNSKQCAKCSRQQFRDNSSAHGMCGTPTYRTWERVVRKGEVCRSWTNFESFLQDMGKRPTVNHFLVRTDSSTNWRPGNAQWLHKTQARKRPGRGKLIRYKGRSQSLTDWAKEIGISTTSLRRRIAAGWTLKQVFETPPLR